MTTFLIISLSILSGIYLERGRQWYLKRERNRWLKGPFSFPEMPESDRRLLFTELHKEDKQIHKIDFKFPEKEGDKVTVPFAGGHVTIERLADDEPPSLEDQLKDAIEREDYAKAIELRDKMKER
jgi:hypothetical protein